MKEANPKEEIDQVNPNDEHQSHAHFQVLNKTKSTLNKPNLFLNLNSPPIIPNNTTKEAPDKNHKKEIAFGAPLIPSPTKKSPVLYQVCEGDTFESISSHFGISLNWLIRQNMKQILNPNFSLSSGIQLNVASPSPSLVKSLDCYVIRNKHCSDLNGDMFTNDPKELGIAYIIIHENSFDFVPNHIDKDHKPIHIKLTSINEDVIVFTPKAFRDKLQKKRSKQISKESTCQLEPINSEEKILGNNYRSIPELASAIAEQLIENSLKINSNDVQVLTEKLEPASNTNINDSEQIKIEKNEEISNRDKNIVQELRVEKFEDVSNTIKNLSDTTEYTKDQKDPEPEKNISSTNQNATNLKETPHPVNDKISLPQIPQEIKSNIGTEKQEDGKNSVLVVNFKTKNNNQIQVETLYFRVRKEEGNEFSTNLQKAIKEAKSKIRARKPANVPLPKSPQSMPGHISSSASTPNSPLSFFQSIFNSIKDTFSHLNDDDDTSNKKDNENGNNQEKEVTLQKSNLQRRSYSQKNISNSLGRPFLSPFNQISNKKEDLKNDSPRPRRNSENGDISSQQNRKVIASSVLLQIKIIDGPSAIFERKEEIDEIRSKLPYRMRSYDWMLIYRLSRDGSSFTNFFNYTRNSGPVVFIMSTSTKERIGAFIPTGFKYSTKYYGSGEAFVFRLVKQDKNKNKSEEKNKKEKESEGKNDNDKESEEKNDVEKESEEKNDIGNESKEKNDNDKESEEKNDNDKESEEKNDNDKESEEKNDIEKDSKEKNDNKNESEIDNNNENDDKPENEEKDENKNEQETENKQKDDDKNQSKNDAEEVNKENTEKVESEEKEEKTFAHIEAFKWTPGTNTSFMMSEKDTIIIGIGNEKDSYTQNDIDAINSSNGHMPGPAIWIGQDLQYASSSPCSTFSSPQLTKKNYFYVDDIEIWKIGFFSKK